MSRALFGQLGRLGHDRRRRLRRAVGLVVALVLVATSCSSSGDDVDRTQDFDGVSVVVGSKNFTEQYVLSEILLQALSARGATVTDATDTGDTATTRAALIDGSIDAYWEYNSTGWVQHLGRTDPDSDGETLTDDVRAADQANGIVWVGRSTFNDTYGFAMSPSIAEETAVTRYSVDAFDLEAMAEYLDDNPDAVMCLEPEFPTRADGLSLFVDETGYNPPQAQQVIYNDAAAIYGAVARGECDFGEVFTTDGRIKSLGLSLVVDPGVFYVYNVSLTLSDGTYAQAGDAFDELVEDILRPMSQARMTELNQRVADGEPVSAVASDFLSTFGINP